MKLLLMNFSVIIGIEFNRDVELFIQKEYQAGIFKVLNAKIL